ncbi:hypothetical protein JCM8202_002216 [Rhodotorula sphaerocarpa]
MAELLRQYLCCCLPPLHGQRDQASRLVGAQDEQTPLLNPDILPAAPPRPAQRTTEQQQAERDQLRRILHLAEQRLLSVESSAPFRSVAPAPPPAPANEASASPHRPSRRRHRSHQPRPPHSSSSSKRPDHAARSLSESSSSTLTARDTGSRTRHTSSRRRNPADDDGSPSSSRSRGGQAHWGMTGSGSAHAHAPHLSSTTAAMSTPGTGDEGAGPLAPIRVVRLDRTTWTEIDGPKRGAAAAKGSASYAGRNVPEEMQDGEAAAEESYFSPRGDDWPGYSLANPPMRWEGGADATGTTQTGKAGRGDARDLWSGAGPSSGEGDLAEAIRRLERDIDSWTLPQHGPYVADLGGGGGGGAEGGDQAGAPEGDFAV